MGLKDFPSFSTEAELLKALRAQGFDVGPQTKTAARRVANSSGNAVYIHPASILARSGHSAKNDLSALTSIGFVPPAEHRARTRRLGEVVKQEVEKELAPAPPVVSDKPLACPECAVARCARCEDTESPCVFARSLNLGRHRQAIHGVSGRARPTGTGTPRRSGRVRTRTDPSVISDPFRRLAKTLFRQMQQIAETVGELMNVAEQTEAELEELRRFKKDVENAAGGLYDITTRPRRND